MSTNLTTGARTPFPNNIIPASQLSPIGLALASYYPLPTAGYAVLRSSEHASLVVNIQDRADQGTFKLDHEATKWLKLSASYLHYGSRSHPIQFSRERRNARPDHYTAMWTASQVQCRGHTESDYSVDSAFSAESLPGLRSEVQQGLQAHYARVPRAVDALTPGYPDFPSITTGEFTAYGGGTTSWTVYHSQSFDMEVAKFMGKHSIKAGFDYRLIADASQTATGPSSFGFASGFTSQTAAKTVTGTGGGLASMLLGYPASGSITKGSFFNDYIHYTAFFIQDDYRVTPKLTVNFGFRGEHETNPEESTTSSSIDADLNQGESAAGEHPQPDARVRRGTRA